jgi:thiosulfate dehydrogenase [quinone] large subunit
MPVWRRRKPERSYLVASGELLVGLGLIAGIPTGRAAFFGGLLNFNCLRAGAVSINPTLLVMAFGLTLARRIAGWRGGERRLPPALERIRMRL